MGDNWFTGRVDGQNEQKQIDVYNITLERASDLQPLVSTTEYLLNFFCLFSPDRDIWSKVLSGSTHQRDFHRSR